MKTEFSRGPWKLHKVKPTMVEPSHRVLDANGLLAAEGRAGGGPLAQATANAKLIAAAPQMLAALEVALPFLPHSAYGARDVLHPVLGQVRAAIAAAKGKL